MFTLPQLIAIRSALTVQHKSVLRLAAKEGQPESVAAEYRKVGQEVTELFNAVGAEIVKMEQAAKQVKK